MPSVTSADPPTIIALMIGELAYMARLNPISCAIVEHAVRLWSGRPGGQLVCESAPMTAEAVRLGVDASSVITALPQPAGHTTRLVAEWCAVSHLKTRPFVLVTHTLHASRSVRIFSRLGLRAEPLGLNLRFDANDPDWKLRSSAIFRAYNAAAYVYCRSRGWV